MPTSFVNVAQPFNLANETAQANALVSQAALAATQKDKAQYDLQLQQKLNTAWANAVTTDPNDGHTYVDYNKFAQHASNMGVGPDAQNAYLTFKQNKNIATQGEIMNASTLGALKGDVSKLNETGSSAAFDASATSASTATVSNPVASAAQQASATTATATTPAVTATKSDYDADYAKAIEDKKKADQASSLESAKSSDDSWTQSVPEITNEQALENEYEREFAAENNPFKKAAMALEHKIGKWTPSDPDFNRIWKDKEISARGETGISGHSANEMDLGRSLIIPDKVDLSIPIEYGNAGTPPTANPIATAARQAALARSSNAAPVSSTPTVTATIPSALDLVDRAVSTGIYDPIKLMESMGITTGTGKTEEPDKSLFEWKPIDNNSNIYRKYKSALDAKLNAEGYADASSYLRAIYDAELLKNAAPGINPMVLFADPTHPGVGYSKYGEQLIAQAQGNAQAKGKAQEAVIAAKAKMEEDANKYGVTIEAQNKLDVGDDNTMLRDSSLRKDYVIYKQNIKGIDDTKKQLASAQNLTDLQMLAPSVAKAAGMAFGSQPTQFNIEETYKKAFGTDLDKEQLGKLVISTVAAIKTGNWEGVSKLLSNLDNYDPAIIKKHLGAILDEAKAQSNIGIKNVTVSKGATTAPPPPPSDSDSGATATQNKTWNQLAAERFADASTQSGLKQFKLGGQTIEPDPTTLDINGAVTKGFVIDPATGLRTGDMVRLTESMTGANAATATQYGVSQGANVPSAKGTGQIYLMTEPEPTNPIARAARQAAKSRHAAKSRSLAPLASSSLTSSDQLKEGQSAVIGGVLYRRFNGRIQSKEQ